MTDQTDDNAVVSQNAPTSGANDTSVDSSIAELKARQAGQSRTIDNLNKKLAERQATLDRLAESHETEAGELRRAKAELEVTAKKLQEERDLYSSKASQLEQQYATLKEREVVRQQVAQKHPLLLTELDDLKERSAFENEEAYEEYLVRMETKLGRASQSYAAGSVPSAPRPTAPVNANGQPRTVKQIEDDLWNPQYANNRQALEAELDAAMQREPPRRKI